MQVIFEENDEVLEKITSFIDEALNTGESCLIWSVNGTSRCTCVVAGYMMNKYQWSLNKTLDYINSRRKDINLSPNFVHQLFMLQNRMILNGKVLSNDWNEITNDPEDLVLRNTYLNAKPSEKIEKFEDFPEEKIFCLKWAEFDNFEKILSYNKDDFIVVRSCFKGEKSKFFTFCGKNSKKNAEKKIPTRKNSPGSSFYKNKHTKSVFTSENNNENFTQTDKLSNKNKEKRANSVRVPSPLIVVSKAKDPFAITNRLSKPWK